MLFFIYFFYREAKRLKNERLKYFNNFWNLMEFATMFGSITAIAMYIMKKILAELAMNSLRESGSCEYDKNAKYKMILILITLIQE